MSGDGEVPSSGGGEDRFGAMKITGGRFDSGNGLPLEVSEELSRYNDLVKRVARHLYLKHNSKRKRVPKGFGDDVVLRLTSVEKGSVIPVVERASGRDELGLFESEDYWDESRQVINETLRSIANDLLVPEAFPDEHLAALARLGKSLRSGEDWLFYDRVTDSVEAGRLNVAVRRQVQRIAKIESLEVETVILGHVAGVISDPHEVVFTPADGSPTIRGGFQDPTMFSSLQAVTGYGKRGPLVSLAIIGRERESRLEAIVDVLGVESVLPMASSSRLQHLAGLQPGWAGPEGGEPPQEAALRLTEALLLSLYDEGLPKPAIFPDLNGDLTLEWVYEEFEIHARVSAAFIKLSKMDLVNDDDEELEFPTGRMINAIKWILERQHVGTH